MICSHLNKLLIFQLDVGLHGDAESEVSPLDFFVISSRFNGQVK